MHARHVLSVVVLGAAVFFLATMSSAHDKSREAFVFHGTPFGINGRIEFAPQWAGEERRVALEKAERERLAREEAADAAFDDAVAALSAVVEKYPATKAAADAEAALEAAGFDVVNGRVYPADVVWLSGIPILR